MPAPKKLTTQQKVNKAQTGNIYGIGSKTFPLKSGKTVSEKLKMGQKPIGIQGKLDGEGFVAGIEPPSQANAKFGKGKPIQIQDTNPFNLSMRALRELKNKGAITKVTDVELQTLYSTVNLSEKLEKRVRKELARRGIIVGYVATEGAQALINKNLEARDTRTKQKKSEFQKRTEAGERKERRKQWQKQAKTAGYFKTDDLFEGSRRKIYSTKEMELMRNSAWEEAFGVSANSLVGVVKTIDYNTFEDYNLYDTFQKMSAGSQYSFLRWLADYNPPQGSWEAFFSDYSSEGDASVMEIYDQSEEIAQQILEAMHTASRGQL